MPWQLIYTSAPRGLLSGQSGFCTVARSADLREALVQRLEQISSYHYLRVAEAATAHRNPTISAFRLLDLRGAKYCVLTRIQPCGLDFTARTNHLAHHLVFQADELAQLPSPATILRHWLGWLASWQGEPRHLEPLAAAGFASAAKSFLPAQTWLRMTGDAGRAAGLLETECLRGCYLVCPPGGEAPVLDMFCETLQLLNPNGQFPLRPWRHPFTTFLQAEDNPADFQWRACQEGAPAYQQAVQRSAPLLPLAAVRVPGNSLVKVAREGLKPAAPPASAPDMRRLPAARKQIQRTPVSSPSHQPNISRRVTGLSLIRVYAAVKLRFSLMQQWFSNLPAASRASLGIFAAVLLGFMVMKYWGAIHQPAPDGAPLAPAARRPGEPAPRSGNPASPDTGQTPPEASASAPAERLDTKQLDWLSGNGRTFVFATPDLTRFQLPIRDQIGPFEGLINKLAGLMLPKEIQLSMCTNTWEAQPGEPMSVVAHTGRLSAQTASGLACSIDYSDFLSSTNPVAVETGFPAPLNALSLQFGYSSSSNGLPFRLLIVNESRPPAPMRLGMRWLKTNHPASVAAALQDPLRDRLLGNFTLLQGRKFQFRPFVRIGGQTNYLYANWPAELLPREEGELDFAAVRNSLAERASNLENPSREKMTNLDERRREQARVAEYPFGRDLGLGDRERLVSLAEWCRRNNTSPSQPLFLGYLEELRKVKQGTANSDWVKDWPELSTDDSEETLIEKFHTIHKLWSENADAVRNNQGFKDADFFSDTWQKLKQLDNTRNEEELLRQEIATAGDKVRAWLKLVPASLDKAAYVGLFITDPEQRRPGVEIIRFQGP
jgi:hypothetical protein